MHKISKMDCHIVGDNLKLERTQWQGKSAYITNEPNLVKEVLKYTWTLSGNPHKYLRSSKLKKSLHQFVLEFLYGEESLKLMLEQSNIIEHLDNDGLNCSYENLHIISSNLNKAKAFTIDKEKANHKHIPIYITDVYYCHQEKYFQLQITFNYDIFFTLPEQTPIESIFLRYKTFENLFIDWVYVLNQKDGRFVLQTFHSDSIIIQKRPTIILKEHEKDNIIVERNGKYYLRLNPDGGKNSTWINKSSFKKLDDIEGEH